MLTTKLLAEFERLWKAYEFGDPEPRRELLAFLEQNAEEIFDKLRTWHTDAHELSAAPSRELYECLIGVRIEDRRMVERVKLACQLNGAGGLPKQFNPAETGWLRG